MKKLVLLMAALIGSGAVLSASDEITLFNSRGNAMAYIADDLTIYLWSGKPVAYLKPDTRHDGLDIYGFNGKHLGWFVHGIAWNHDGDGACGVKEVLPVTTLEPLKSLKALKPLKSLRELAPLRPIFSRRWAKIPCNVFLFEGADD